MKKNTYDDFENLNIYYLSKKCEDPKDPKDFKHQMTKRPKRPKRPQTHTILKNQQKKPTPLTQVITFPASDFTHYFPPPSHRSIVDEA